MTKEELDEAKNYVEQAWDDAMTARDSADSVCGSGIPDGLPESIEKKLYDVHNELSYASSNASTACDILEKLVAALDDLEPEEGEPEDGPEVGVAEGENWQEIVYDRWAEENFNE